MLVSFVLCKMEQKRNCIQILQYNVYTNDMDDETKTCVYSDSFAAYQEEDGKFTKIGLDVAPA